MANYRRVNGALLANFSGNPVCLLGKVLKAESSGTAFTIQSSDNMVVNIALNEPLSGYLDGLIEVYGTASGKNMIQAEKYNVLPSKEGVEFDMDAYNEAVKLLQTTSGPW